jgi:hypothetical protein
MAINQSVNLFDIVSYVESRGNPLAIRFEPLVYGNISRAQTAAQKEIIQNIVKIHGCSIGTAQMIYSTSWGAIQMMGFNLYGDLGYSKTVHDFQDDSIGQVDCFYKFISQKGIAFSVSDIVNSPDKKHLFAQKYNGDIQAYSNMLDMSLHHYGVN